MSKIEYLNDNTLMIAQEHNTLFIQKNDEGVRIKDEFITTDGYEVGIVINFDTKEARELFSFLKQHQLY